jgi:uncharacterized membrane protein YeiB
MTIKEEITEPAKKSKRVLWLDAARGLAVIGMYVQHFALNGWNANIVSGNTMILFILCSGISYSIMTARAKERNTDEKQFSARMLARSIFIDLLGYILIMLNGPFAVILPAYAGLFIIALGLRNLSDKALKIISGILFVVSPFVMIIGLSLFGHSSMLSDIAGGPLSSIALLPVFTAGMIIGRSDLRSIRRAAIYVISGAIMLVISKLIAYYVLPGILHNFETWFASLPSYANVKINEYAIWPRNCNPISWNMLLVAIPQSGTTVQLIMGMGASLLVIGFFSIIENKAAIILKPFSMVGQVALTLYALQFIVAWIFETVGIKYDFGSVLCGDIMAALVTTVIGCLLNLLPQRPIEGLMRRFEGIFS